MLKFKLDDENFDVIRIELLSCYVIYIYDMIIIDKLISYQCIPVRIMKN